VQIYNDFGSEVKFTMVPFVFGSVSRPSCFDESSPCKEEQAGYCVIDIAQKADADSQFPGQDKIVPFFICHNKGNSLSSCYSQVGIDESEVDSCLNDSSRMTSLLTDYINKGSSVRGTPYELVNGHECDSSYGAVKSAICKADSSVSACKSDVQV